MIKRNILSLIHFLSQIITSTLYSDEIAPVKKAVDDEKPDLNFMRLDSQAGSDVESISIGYSILGRADNISVVPLNERWSDLSSWDALWCESNQDEKGVALSGNEKALDCENTLRRSESNAQELVGLSMVELAKRFT